MTAAAAVFDTAELLETILLQLSMGDILRAQCVDRTFCDTVKKSPSLQRALFFKPCVDFAATFNDWQFYCAKDCASLKDCDGAPAAPLVRGMPKYEYVRTTSGEKCSILCNPLLPRFNGFEVHGVSVWVDQLRRTSQAKGRWEEMLLTQPPLQRALVYTLESNHNHMLHSDEGAAGITIGCLQRYLKRFDRSASSHVYIWCEGHRVIIPDESTAAEILVAIEDAIEAKPGENTGLSVAQAEKGTRIARLKTYVWGSATKNRLQELQRTPAYIQQLRFRGVGVDSSTYDSTAPRSSSRFPKRQRDSSVLAGRHQKRAR